MVGFHFGLVALRKESVDRNDYFGRFGAYPAVALRKESVDRNFVPFDVIRPAIDVALRKESVDRNPLENVANGWPIVSLSARRAWIEISG